MLEPIVILSGLAVAGLSPSAATLSLRHHDGLRWASDLEAVEIHLPGDLDYSAIETLLAGLSGLRAPSRKRPFVMRGVVWEVVATGSGIRHFLLVDPLQRDIVLSHLRGALPNVGITIGPDYVPGVPTWAGELEASSSRHQLRVDNPKAVSSAILAALMPLGPEESVTIQLVLQPLGSRPLEGSGRPWWLEAMDPKKTNEKSVTPKATRDKYAHPLFAAGLRLGVTAGSPARARHLLSRVTASFHVANAPEAHLRRRRARRAASRRLLVGRRPHLLRWPLLLNSIELSALMAWPGAGISLPGLTTGGTRQLAPSNSAETGRVLADATFPGFSRPVALSVIDSLQHLWILGGTGTGKSTIMLNLILQDIAAGFCVIVIDPKRDLVEDVKNRIALGHMGRVIILDPLDTRPVGINILNGGGANPELIAEELYGILYRLNKTSWGPRMADLLRTALLTLALTPGSILPDLPRLLTDATYRRQVVGALDDPVGLEAAWAAFDAMSEGEQNQAVAPILNKTRPLVTRKRLRYVFGQTDPLLDIDDVMAKGQVLLVPLSGGELGADAAAFLGAVLTTMIFQAVMRRVRLPKEERRPVFLYVDEAQMLSTLPTPLADLLATARGLGVGVTLGNQFLAQFDSEMREAVLGTVRSRLVFQTAATDAARLAKDVAPHLSAHDLQALGAYEAVASLVVDSYVTPPVTVRTRPAPPALGTAAEVEERSRQRWGRDRDEIEQSLRDRYDGPKGGARIGRQRRSS